MSEKNKDTDLEVNEEGKLNSHTIDTLKSLWNKSLVSAFPHWQRAREIQKMFDGSIDPGEFGTMSELFLPVLRSAVNRSLADAIEYAFPKEGISSLVPTKGGIQYEEIQKLESGLDNVLMNVMDVKRKSIPIIQDALKFGCGYGIVENIAITTAEEGVFSVIDEDGNVATREEMRESSVVQLIPNLRHLDFFSVVPSPDGSTPEDASCVMTFDMYSEDNFRKLYESQEGSKNPIYTGDPDEIIEATKKMGVSSYNPQWWNQLLCGTENTATMAQKFREQNQVIQSVKDQDKGFNPIQIPVVKFHFNREILWLANGDTLIFHDKDKYETLRKPIIKASLSFDSDNWWALSDAAASRDVARGINIYFNGLLDVMGQYLRPMMAYDTTRYDGDDVPRYQPHGLVGFNGDVSRAFSVINPPQLANGLMQFGDKMQLDYNRFNNEPLNGQATAGMVRGGSFALEDLLQTQNAPREFAGMLLDMGFIKPLVEHVLIKMQTLPQETFEYVDLDGREYVDRRIALKDFKRGFTVSTDLVEKLRKSNNNKMMDLTFYQQVVRGNPLFKESYWATKLTDTKEDVEFGIRNEEELQKYMEQMQQQSQSVQAESPMAQGQRRGS